MKIEVKRDALVEYLGKRVTLRELEKLLRLLKVEIDEVKGDLLKLEVIDTNRPELLSTEGIARELRRFLGKPLRKYKVKNFPVRVIVDRSLSKIRPYIACSILRGLRLNEELIESLILLQERLDLTIGRKRKKTSIGLYDFNKLKPPLYYTTASPDLRFVPLGFKEELSLKEILEKHPKGVEYGHLLEGLKKYPILLDSKGRVLSFPPIINSEEIGKVTSRTRNILVEVTGTDLRSVSRALNIVTMNLIDMGGKAYGATIIYPNMKIRTPSFKDREMDLRISYLKEISGLDPKISEIKNILRKMGFKAKPKGKDKLRVVVPFYREDVMHEVDLVEEFLIGYGFNKIKPEKLDIVTTGKFDELDEFLEDVRELMVGLGFQEILSFTLTNKDLLFRKMRRKENRVVEILNPISKNFSCLRNSILPSLLEFASKNKRYDYPQRIFEIGEVFFPNEDLENKVEEKIYLGCLLLEQKASFSSMKSIADVLFREFGVKVKLEEEHDPSFIEGRCGKLVKDGRKIGIIGEINPYVLEEFGLIMPTAALEIDLGELFGDRGSGD